MLIYRYRLIHAGFSIIFSPGELIISPQRGSVRGIVGHVETSVDTYDDFIEHEKKRSISLPPGAYSLMSSKDC